MQIATLFVSTCMHLLHATLLEKKGATWNPFCPVFRTLWGKGSQIWFFTCSRTGNGSAYNQKLF